jgi:hypothetical protein
MFLVPNIDQMYKKMKKIVEVGNGDEFPDFADLFFFGIKNVRVGRPETHIFFFGLICIFILKKKKKKKSLPTYPPLPSMGRPTANKDIFKSGLIEGKFD